MNWQIQNQIKSLNLGDLVRVDWYDASVGKSSFSKGSIDIPSRTESLFPRHTIGFRSGFSVAR